MKKFTSQKLNLPRLLALGELDIRGIAAVKRELTAREYFSKVEWFIEDAPQYEEALKYSSDAATLEEVNRVLAKIGYYRLNEDIASLIQEIKLGQDKPTGQLRAKAVIDFNRLCERLKSAYTEKDRRHVQVRTERFLREAPRYISELTYTLNLDKLEEIKNLLTWIGYDNLNTDIESLISQIQEGQSEQIAEQGAELSGKLIEYYEKFKNICIEINDDYAQFIESEPEYTESAEPEPLLGEALEYLDFEEAHRKLRILAVDDVASVLNSVVSILSPQYEVFALTKAEQVEKFLTHTTPELFLLDIEMPELSGYDLVSVIRKFDEHKDTPIIFLTGSATLENVKTAVALGASDFITKPIDSDTLLKKIESKIAWRKAF